MAKMYRYQPHQTEFFSKLVKGWCQSQQWNTRTMCEICLKLIITILESGVPNVNFEHDSHIVLAF